MSEVERDTDDFRDDQQSWPELRLMTSTGLPAHNVPGNEQAREPTGNEVDF
jgi:hypothetical protein